jgi:hypothetical protein
VPLRVAALNRETENDPSVQQMAYRVKFLKQLESTPGDHLVLVHYTTEHDVGQEWVYNRADIDGAKVVWARVIPGVDSRPLLDYFRGRTLWSVEADSDPPRLERVSPEAH